MFWPNKYPTRFCVVVAFLSTSSSHSCQCISLHVEHLDLEPVTASLFGSTLWAVQHWARQCALRSRTCSASLELERRNGTYTKPLYEPGCQMWFLEVLVQRGFFKELIGSKRCQKHKLCLFWSTKSLEPTYNAYKRNPYKRNRMAESVYWFVVESTWWTLLLVMYIINSCVSEWGIPLPWERMPTLVCCWAGRKVRRN